MNQVYAFAERVLPLPVDDVRAAVGDYTGLRSRLLPDGVGGYEVITGGQGAGTVLRFTRRGRVHEMAVSTPRPGLLVEADRASSLVVTWSVDGSDDSASVRVSLTHDGANGPLGLLARVLAPVRLRRVLDELLAGLAARLG